MKKWMIILAFIGPITVQAAPPWKAPQPVSVVIEEVVVTTPTTTETTVVRESSMKMISGSLGIAAAGLQFGRGLTDLQGGCYVGNDSLTTSLACGAGARLKNGWFVNGTYGRDLDLEMDGWNLGFMMSIK